MVYYIIDSLPSYSIRKELVQTIETILSLQKYYLVILLRNTGNHVLAKAWKSWRTRSRDVTVRLGVQCHHCRYNP
jgi:hypothetical protein